MNIQSFLRRDKKSGPRRHPGGHCQETHGARKLVASKEIEYYPNGQRAEKGRTEAEGGVNGQGCAPETRRCNGHNAGGQRCGITGDRYSVKKRQNGYQKIRQGCRKAEGGSKRCRTDHHSRYHFAAAEFAGQFVAADAGRKPDQVDQKGDSGWAPGKSARRLHLDAECQERHDPGAHGKKLPHVGGVTEDISH